MLLNRVFSVVRYCRNLNARSVIGCFSERLTFPYSVIKETNSYSTALLTNIPLQNSLLQHPTIVQLSQSINERSVTKFSWRKGKRKSDKDVVDRFYRLAWGGWVRTIAGRYNSYYKKSSRNRRRTAKHVLCNALQSRKLDAMVGPYWRKRRWYVDDPYEPYQEREEFVNTYKKPRPFISNEDC